MLYTDLILFFEILQSCHDKTSSNMIWYFFKSGDCSMSGKLREI